jgi:hypothetical protein
MCSNRSSGIPAFLLALVAGAALTSAEPAAIVPQSGVYLTVPEALELAFPECAVERGTVYLTKEQKRAARKLAECDVPWSIIHPYTATKDGEVVGTAYFDTHLVRSMKETLMVVIGSDETVRRIEVLAFGEPEDYLPRAKWYAQFLGRELDEDLTLKRKISGISGATLSARATTDAVRRSLALHQVIHAEPEGVAVEEGG